MNKVAFITGASRGIGREAALAFARAGFDLAISARTLNEGEQHEHALRDAAGAPLAGSLNGTAQALRELGCRVLVVPMDLLDSDSALARLPGGAGRVRAHRRADQQRDLPGQ